MHVAKPLIAVPHALVAQSFFGLLVAIIVFTSKGWSAPKEVKTDAGRVSIRRLSTWAVVAVLIQLVLGAGFRHLAFGVLPHFIGAVIVTALILWTSITVLRRHRDDAYLARPAIMALALVGVQVFLGVMAYIWRMAAAGDPVTNAGQFFGSMTLASLEKFNQLQPVEPSISLSAAHLVVGALTLATLIVLALRSYQVLAQSGERAVEVSQQTLGSSPRRVTV
jgi:heme A synthase